MNNLLEYEKSLFLDAFSQDGLLILARGLGIERVFVNLLKVYADPGNLVLVLNTNSHEEEYFMELLEGVGVKQLPKVITNEYGANERQNIYMEGGVLFITSRILVVDLLTDRVPTDLVTGILVYKAHRILESCQEAFILRLYRQKNKKGFIKAFSDSPHSFTSGFCHVERVMKSLFVRKLFLWPRFHGDVVACLEKHKPDVIELELQMTPSMSSCQTAILDLLDACIKELKRGNSTLDTEEITVEHAITRRFDKIVRLHLDPIWHQLSPKTKQLISDIKMLRLVIMHLTQYDCVNFFSLVNSIRSSERTFGQNSGWLFTDSADSLFLHAKERVYGPTKKVKMKDSGNEKKSEDKVAEPLLEGCPKWHALKDVLEEINEDIKSSDPSLGPYRVLVAAEDDRTCSQIKEYLCSPAGGRELLTRLYNSSIAIKTGAKLPTKQQENKSSGKGKGKGKSSSKTKTSASALTLTQLVNTELTARTESEDYADDELSSSSGSSYHIISSPVTVLHPLHGSNDRNSLVRTLYELQPRYVVLYDADMVFVRQLEVFKASQPGVPLRVYFMMYKGSTEEQRYLTSLRIEKEAFEYLIREKATMVIPEEREGRLEDDPNLARDVTAANATVNTRKAGLPKTTETQKIIVDMREFRSELPSLIHRRGIDIEPVTIEVGDYILTPDICVERKSLSDLIGSLNSGRLYNQCVAMTRFYKRPVLLIEFDPNKPFALQGKYPISSEISTNDVLSRLTLLTIHFPRLRILWCQSPYATAELFEELKLGQRQPDTSVAMAITTDSSEDLSGEKYNHGPQNMLLKMPGINTKNVHLILKSVQDIAELCTLSQERLTDILSSGQNAKALWEFLHAEHKRTEATAAIAIKPTKSSKQSNFRGVKRKK